MNHSIDDVKKKLEEQAPFLPAEIHQELGTFLANSVSQERLNELFHLLKKYDLASDTERAERNDQIRSLIHGFAP